MAELTNANIREYVFLQLGLGAIQVELSTNQLDLAITDSIDVWSRYKPKIEFHTISSSQGITAYQLDSPGPEQLLKTSFRSILQVFPDFVAPQLNQVEFNYPFYQRLITITNVGEWALLEQWLEVANRTLSAHFDWRYHRTTNTLYVAHSPFSATKLNLTIAKDRVLTDIESYDHADFRQYVLAKSMLILSRIRRKFPVAGPNGDITLDGAELKTEADAIIEKIDNKLAESSYELTIAYDN